MKKGIITVLLVIVILFLGLLLMEGIDRGRVEKAQVKLDTIETVKKVEDVGEPKPQKEETKKVVVKETFSQKQVIKKAESYLGIFGFSRQGLIDQLKYDGFTTEEAIYAVNKIGF